MLNPRQYYELIQGVGSSGLINRDVQGTALQSGNGVIEIAGITIYKSMNIPFFGSYGTKYGSASATNPGITSPGNVGSFVGETAEDGIRDRSPSRGLGDVYKRQVETPFSSSAAAAS